jgi:pilus assembly protein Flp/PilA
VKPLFAANDGAFNESSIRHVEIHPAPGMASTTHLVSQALERSGRPDMQFIRKLIGSGKGATAIEYSLIAALIAVAAIAAIQGVGTSLNSTFTNVSSAIK